ncbi:hypothetical protein LMH87_010730 [Akanthomyces muscarius]|uniref:DUF7719 domain-containing protein n=1 Tax=Akanthomyces muscarius TaxID=2231603 RepID=A0A9W8UHT0_AKAMU|nr:hypothetical protein LMH87_010730 [Akanthomyces muscarius]KAJ4149958.1 hypothetical protein LMH87_010730 [Akanthomyces muscarius]
MARSRKTPTSGTTTTLPPLSQPDRSGAGVDEQTLFKIAEQRQLFQQAAAREKQSTVAAKQVRVTDGENDSSDDDEDDEVPTLSPGAERVLEAMLWTTSLAMLHFTFDVLVQHQYGTEIMWWQICQRAFSAWAVFLLLFYALHPRKSDETLLPGLPARYQSPLRQAVFFTISVVSGCYLIYVTNMKGYLATQKRAPPLGCLWIWAVMELDLPWATLSLVVASAYIYLKGYNVK